MKDIIRKVARVQRRMFINRFLEAWALTLLVCATALVGWCLLDKVIFLNVDPLVAFAAAFGASLLGAGLLTWLSRPRLLSAAMLADEGLGLKERVSSVLALDCFETEMERALRDDTMARVQRLSLAEAAPIELPRRMRWVPVPVVAAILCLFLPDWDVFSRKVTKEKELATTAVVEKQAEKLQKTMEMLKEKTKGQEMKEAARIATEFEKITNDFKKGITRKEDAMAKLSSLAEQVKQRQDQLANKKGQANDLKSALGKDDGKEPSEMEKKLAQGKFGEVAKDLEQKMQDMKSGKMSEAQKQQLGKDLQTLAKAMKDAPSIQSLQKAAENAGQELQSMDPKDAEQALSDLNNLSKQLGDMNKTQSEGEALQQAMQDLQQMQDQLSQGDQQTCPDCGQQLGKGESQEDHKAGGS